MAVDDIFKVTIDGVLLGQLVQTVLHARLRTGSATPAGLAATLGNSVGPLRQLLVDGWADDLTYSSINLTQWVPYGAATLSFPLTGWTGNSVADPSAPQDAMVVTKNSPFIGRSRRGRIYICGVVETSHSGGLFIGALVTTKQTQAALVASTYGQVGSDPDYELGIYSQVLGGPPPGTSLAGYAPITNLVVRNIVRSQRRRQVGVGR